MEYVQTVLVQIEASAMDEASRPGGLLAELNEHRSFLRQQHGFQEMQITRSINAEGNVLVVVETRWQDDSSLVEYETHEPNVTSIVNKYPELIIRDSLQVLDMEAVRAEAARHVDTATQVTERLALPLIIPLGALAFALLVIYGLSRIYLEVNSDVATPLAAGISVGVLAIAWYISSRPGIPGWQIASIGMLAAVLLTGGALFAVIDEDEGQATEGTPTPAAAASPTAQPSPGTPGAGIAVSMQDNFFEPAELTVKAGESVTIDLTNDGVAVHNMRIAGADGNYNTDDDAVSDPQLVTAGGTAVVNWTAPGTPGEVKFQCDFHVSLGMVGTITVE
jgi:plastocyanin